MMASGHPGDAVRLINRLFQDGTVGGMTDGQLLERFATGRGEAAESAFEALVTRHGSMVLRVCRGLLRDPHDVEDAFQATFLVLVRRAGSIGERELLGPWLYGVALRVSRKARSLAARRSRREGGIVADDPAADDADAAWLDLRPVLHEELGRLPEKYRQPVVLCHLQGLTHAEAARELAWPVGTVSVRLARARKLLRDRLTRRGLTVTASLWGAGLAAEGASAAVPQALIRSTTMAATAFAAGRSLAAGTASAGAVALTRSYLTMMLLGRLKWAALALALGTGTTGALIHAQGTPARDPARRPAPATARSPRPAVEDPVKGDDQPEAVPPVVARDGSLVIDPVPPGYFDLPPAAARGGPATAPVKPGQILVVEVLEALPGRPLTGERVVRPDGTISLGFYGDLPVAGLDRNQIKVKLLQHMRKYLIDEVLGLVVVDPDGKARIKPAVESNRVFVDDSAGPDSPGERTVPPKVTGPPVVGPGQVLVVEVLQALSGRPITGERLVRPDGTISLGFYGDLAVAGLTRDEIKVKVIEHLRKYLSPSILGLEVSTQDPADESNLIVRKIPPAESTHVFVDESSSYFPPRTREAGRKPARDDENLRDRVDALEDKLDRVLRELRELRRERRPAKPDAPAGARPF